MHGRVNDIATEAQRCRVHLEMKEGHFKQLMWLFLLEASSVCLLVINK